MTLKLQWRLLLDLASAALLIFSLSYWWLGNLTHEVAGTLMLANVIVHNVLNRRFYPNAPRVSGFRNTLNLAIVAALAVTMLALLVTSALMSRTVIMFPDLASGFTLRQVHILAAYWALVIVGVHLGLRWPMIMGFARQFFGLSKDSVSRRMILPVVALLIGA